MIHKKMYTDLKKVYYQCLDAINIIAYNGYLHSDVDFIICLTMTKISFFKKRNLCKICHIEMKYSEEGLESIKYSHVKLFIFYNKIFNDIRKAKKIDSLLGDLFSMEKKYNFKVVSTSYTSSIYLNISNIKRTFLFDIKLHFTFEKQQLLLLFLRKRSRGDLL